MGFYSGIDIASSGLSAQRLRQEVIANNIANVNTTRTTDGGPFRRSRVIFAPIVDRPYWKSPFLPKSFDNGGGKGVHVVSVEKDYDTQLRLKYDPTHPDAIQSGPRAGYVEYPNVNMITEMVDLIAAERAYQANVEILNTSKTMFDMSLQIGQQLA